MKYGFSREKEAAAAWLAFQIERRALVERITPVEIETPSRWVQMNAGARWTHDLRCGEIRFGDKYCVGCGRPIEWK